MIDSGNTKTIAETILNDIARTDGKTAVQIGIVGGQGNRAYFAYRYPYSGGNYGVCMLLSVVDYTLVVVKNYNGTYTTTNVV